MRPALRLALVAALCLSGGCRGEPRAHASPPVRIRVGPATLTVRIAATPASRRRGLQGVHALGASEGMLFVYRDDAPRRYWMRGCRLALDIAFLDAHGTVLQVDTLQPPRAAGEEPARTRRSPPARYALETQAGFFARYGLGVGSRVHLPAHVRAIDAAP